MRCVWRKMTNLIPWINSILHCYWYKQNMLECINASLAEVLSLAQTVRRMVQIRHFWNLQFNIHWRTLTCASLLLNESTFWCCESVLNLNPNLSLQKKRECYGKQNNFSTPFFIFIHWKTNDIVRHLCHPGYLHYHTTSYSIFFHLASTYITKSTRSMWRFKRRGPCQITKDWSYHLKYISSFYLSSRFDQRRPSRNRWNSS